MKTQVYLLSIILVLVYSCKPNKIETDATGVFEATEIIVSAEASGKLLSFTIEEGDEVKQGQTVGQIDSSQLFLNKLTVEANRMALLSGRPNVQSQLDALESEIANAEFEKKRIEKLLAGDAATQKQLDDINSRIQVLKDNLKAKKIALNIQTEAIDSQSQALEAQMNVINDQLARSTVTSPINGTILVKYAEQGELAGVGKPLFQVADLERMILRAYVTGNQLPQLQVGQKIKVLAEIGEKGSHEYEGEITWISGKAEFTPKTIQTQDERANLVYAVKIAVPNDGNLKIGMYAGIVIPK